MKIFYLKDLTDRGNQRVNQEDTEKDPIDLLVGYLTTLRDRLKRGTLCFYILSALSKYLHLDSKEPERQGSTGETTALMQYPPVFVRYATVWLDVV